MTCEFLKGMFDTLLDRGRHLGQGAGLLSDGHRSQTVSIDKIEAQCRALLSGKGEASGRVMAQDIGAAYDTLDDRNKAVFFAMLASAFGAERTAIDSAWRRFEAADTSETRLALLDALEPPRQELFRRLNRAPGGTKRLVDMRADFNDAHRHDAALAEVEHDLAHLLQSWFNTGFLVLRSIDWSTPASVLERLIAYESVHQIKDWGDLRRRLSPADRLVYAFFHPALGDDPLIFVEVALTNDISSSIQSLLTDDRVEIAPEDATTAMFYSINNCQRGLRGISFGNFLIKQVVSELRRDLPNLKTFSTLSPVPRFRKWLASGDTTEKPFSKRQRDAVALLDAQEWSKPALENDKLRPAMFALARRYFLEEKSPQGLPIDPVARFHLGNGATLERFCWLGDTSTNGLTQSAGLMVNYLYDLKSLEANHEAFVGNQIVATSAAIRRIAE
ncbi:MAG: malonyl-CoA decarboxylase [Pseudomonadota bacterium]